MKGRTREQVAAHCVLQVYWCDSSWDSLFDFSGLKA